MRSGEIPRIYAFWHCNVLFGPALHRGERAVVLTSFRGWGEILEVILRKYGHGIIRGSNSRHGRRALHSLIRKLRLGCAAAISPDGPQGPPLEVKEGIVIAASLSGATIIPVHFEATRQWISTGWDRSRLPLPFSTVVCRYGDPLPVPDRLDADGVARFRKDIEEALLLNMRLCREICDMTDKHSVSKLFPQESR